MSSYPYRNGELVPNWHDRNALFFSASAFTAAVVAISSRSSLALADIDDIILRIGLPACLAIVLALAPAPATRMGRIAKDLTVLGLISAIFAGDLAPVAIASFPLVLATSALLSRYALATRIWPEGDRLD